MIRYYVKCWKKSRNSLWPNDAIWHHRPWLSVVKTMPCWLSSAKSLLIQILTYFEIRNTLNGIFLKFMHHHSMCCFLICIHGSVSGPCVTKYIIRNKITSYKWLQGMKWVKFLRSLYFMIYSNYFLLLRNHFQTLWVEHCCIKEIISEMYGFKLFKAFKYLHHLSLNEW